MLNALVANIFAYGNLDAIATLPTIYLLGKLDTLPIAQVGQPLMSNAHTYRAAIEHRNIRSLLLAIHLLTLCHCILI